MTSSCILLSRRNKMSKCDRCNKQRAKRDLLCCTCCDGDFCIVGDVGETCADKHEAGD
ncbi:hypothetical protein LCGC14_2754650 [marine sediment metagenome]|uniref:Uncharacterized protein n=1 Tax=marine sediment metagenome TaxID=412755 RepID=A0A0F8Z0M2_9ZZZZ